MFQVQVSPRFRRLLLPLTVFLVVGVVAWNRQRESPPSRPIEAGRGEVTQQSTLEFGLQGGRADTENTNTIVDLPPKVAGGSQDAACDFEVVVSEPSFCVIQGRTHEIPITLVSVAGVCNGSATLSVGGFPPGTMADILPSPKMEFKNGIASATVKIDTTGVNLKEAMAASTLAFSVSKDDLRRTTKADMIVDQPADFSLTPYPASIQLHQEGSAKVAVRVDRLGRGCAREEPVTLSLDTSSLPSFVRYDLSSDRVLPPGKAMISFKALSGPETGKFRTTLVGWGEKKEKSAQITLDITLPAHLAPNADDAFPGAPSMVGRFSSIPMEEMFEIFGFTPEAQEATRKRHRDLSEKGYIESSESAMDGRLQELKTLIHPIDLAAGRFTFEPAAIKNTPFEGLRQEGGVDYYKVGEKYAALNRIFTMPDGATVMLTEWDYLTSGGGSVYSNEDINEDVNGFPARLTTYKSPSGKALTSMEWEMGGISYTLEMEGAVKGNDKYSLFLDMARSIPMQIRKGAINKDKRDGLSPVPLPPH